MGIVENMHRIFIIEDDRELNAALCYALDKQGYQVVSAFSISEANKI